MSWAKEIKTGLEVLKARITGRRVPFFVQLVPTSRCNLSCRYCFAQFSEREGEDFPRAELLRVIGSLAALGTRFLMLTGGEPMMYPWIDEVVKKVSESRITCLLNTNGLKVAERIDELSGVDVFSISLDGPKDLHDYYRGPGTYDIAVDAIKAARSRGKRVQLQYTMTRDLQQAFGHVVKIAEENGCFIGINFLRPQLRTNGEVVGPAEATQGEIEEFLERLFRTKPPMLPYPRHLLEYVRGWPYDFGRHLIARPEELGGFRPRRCFANRFLIAIDNKGDIYPCTKWFYTEPLGNCADGDIITAWRKIGPLECEACLDLGCNLINDLLRLNPASSLGLLSTWLPGRGRR